ncbi:MAG: CinA family protein, partial [Polyangiaceae bacterium]
VSEPVVRMMAEGALEHSHAHVAVAVTGVAGPDGGTPLKPVGTVHFATVRANQSVHHRMEQFDLDSRWEIQMASVQIALEMLRERLR